MTGTKGKRRLPHRGAPNNPAQFAPAFLKARLGGFEKDMRICLKGIRSGTRTGITHAYFPALTTCSVCWSTLRVSMWVASMGWGKRR